MMMPVAQQCSICKQAFMGSDAIEIPPICQDCKRQKPNYKFKVSVTWGDGPDMLLVNEGEHYILYDDPTLKDRWTHGVSFQGSFDLSLANAKKLRDELIIAIRNVEELEMQLRIYESSLK